MTEIIPTDDRQEITSAGDPQPPAAPALTSIPPLAAAILHKLIDGQPVNGHLSGLADPWQSIAQAILTTPPNKSLRTRAFEAAIDGRPDRTAIIGAVLAAPIGANLAELAQQEAEQAPSLEDDEFEDAPILQTDLGNARRFALQFGCKLRYTLARGWLVWNGKKWEEDKTGRVMRLAKETIKTLYREAERALDKARAKVKAIEEAEESGDEAAGLAAKAAQVEAIKRATALINFAIKSQGRARIEAMIALAQSEPEISARAEDFDRDPWLFNVQNGVLDLRTGELRAHDPNLLMTKIAGTSYYPDATCPTWLTFLERIFSNKRDLIDFMQRAAGYSLSGDVGEQCLFFLYGTGANGKSTFTNALQDAMGDYAMKTRAETLMVKKQDSIPEEIAQLAGVRFMLAAELGEGQQLNESLIKDLTGGDKLRARKLYHDSFEFYPGAKPWLYGNHKPVIKGSDNGIWRRPKLIPFTVTIPESERDSRLPEKLRAELPGILAWAVAGCLDWQRGGLQTPAEVMAATEQYRAEQDLIQRFIDDCLLVNKIATVTAGDLYTAYRSWAEENGLRSLSNVSFSRQMAEKGFEVVKKADGKPERDASGRAYYQGLGLTQAGGEYIKRARAGGSDPQQGQNA